MYRPQESQTPVEGPRPRSSVVARAGVSLPLRAFALALLATVAVWGPFLLSSNTLSPEAQVRGIYPLCRAGTPQLICLSPYAADGLQIDAGGPGWVNIPDDYYFRRARSRGEPRPHWNPFVGSGYPVALDGHSSALSPTQWFLSHIPGDRGRDLVTFTRFLFWTFGITWVVGLCGGSTLLLAGVAATAVLAPYAASYLDIVFMDVDLLGPWFLLALVGLARGRLSLRSAALLCLALGVLVGTLGFLQAQLVFCVAVSVLAIAAVPSTQGRSLLLAACVAAGNLLVVSSWLPTLRNLDQFISSRNAQCVVQWSEGSANFWTGVLHPISMAWSFSATVTAVGAGLLLFTPRRWWFILATLAVIGPWTVLGLPARVCSIPLLSGVRFSRHLIPHFQLLFIFAVAMAIQAIADRLGRKRLLPWFVFLAACAGSLVIARGAAPDMQSRVLACSTAGAVLGLVAFLLWGGAGIQPRLRRGAFGLGLILFAFPTYFFGSPIAVLICLGRARAPQVAPLPTEIDPSTPLGAVQRLSQREDRRHYSPTFLHPNWSATIGVLDLLSLNAFYPVGYHELNGSLFSEWVRDPSHGLVPDRFVPVPPKLTMTTEFQRVMVLNRVSLLTFDAGQATFAEPGSPYAASRCRLLARVPPPGGESYVCPDVGGVGYFPEVVGVVKSRAEAIEAFRRAPPSELARLALLGPEIDLSLDGAGASTPVAGAGRVLSVDRRGDELTYVLEVEQGGVFVVADTYFRGWTATINGQPAGISRANVAFKAVRVPKGKVELKLHFTVAM